MNAVTIKLPIGNHVDLCVMLRVACTQYIQAARFSTQEGVSVRYLGAIARTSRGSSRTTFKKVLVRFKEVIRSFSKGSRRLFL